MTVYIIIYSMRNLQNAPGLVFDPTNLYTIYAEDWAEMIAAIENAGGSATIKEKTYSELQALKDSASLEFENVIYKMTDFKTINNAGLGLTNTGDIEPIFLRAKNSDTFFKNVTSDIYIDDIILYDFDDDALTSFGSGGWEDSVDFGDSIITSNYHQNYFDIDKELVFNDNFYIYHESDAGDIEYDAGMLDTDFTFTDNGDGTWRITDLTGNADFSNGDYNYGEIESEIKTADRPGKIIFRKDPFKRIETTFDFRGVKYARKKIDSSAYSDYDSSSTYSKNDIVKYNNGLYIASMDNPVGSVAGYAWVKLLSNIEHNYNFIDPHIAYINFSLIAGSEKLFPVFGYYDMASENVTFNLQNTSDVKIYDENNIFIKQYESIQIKNVNIGNGSKNNTFSCGLSDVDLGTKSENNIFDFMCQISNIKSRFGLMHSIFSGYVIDSDVSGSNLAIYNIQKSKLDKVSKVRLHTFNNSEMGNSSYDTILGNCSLSKFGKIFNHNFLYQSKSNEFGDYCQNNFFKASNNEYNKIGHKLQNMIFNGGTFKQNIFGNNNGKLYTNITWNGNIIGNVFGNDNFYLGTSNFGSTVQNNIFGNNTRAFTITGQFIDNIIGTGVSNLSAQSCYRNTIGNGTSQINFAGHNMYNNIFGPGLNWFNFTGSGNILKNNITATHVDFGSGSPYITKDFNCDVYQRPDGTIKVSFIGDSDTLEVYDPTT